MSAPLSDAEARLRAETELGTSFVVEAAAGSGKTTLLVRRLAALAIERRVPLRRILATTFSERAAGEITLRLREELERRRMIGRIEERAAAERALGEMEDARIGTLHGLAAELLREVPLAAGIDPEFTVLGGEEADALLARALRAHLGPLLAAPPEGLRRWLRRARRAGAASPFHRLTQALETLAEQRDLQAPWAPPPGFSRQPAIDALVDGLDALLARSLAARSGSELARALAALRALRAAWPADADGARDHDGIEAALAAMTKKELEGLLRGGRSAAETELAAARDAWLAQRAELLRDLDADLAARLRVELTPALARYEAEKRARGALDFHDLLAVLLCTLRTSEEARRFFAARIDHVVVDEVQDSDPVQLELIALLASGDPAVSDPAAALPGPGKLFVVGDPKQSIYGFRRASVEDYLRFRDRLRAAGVPCLTLDATFRCPPSIARIVDRALGNAFDPGPFQPAYVPLAPVRAERRQPHVIALPVPAPFGFRGDVHRDQVQRQIPGLVAAFLEHLLHRSGFLVEEQGALVPVRARHVALLYRSGTRFREDLLGPVAHALEGRGILHTHVGGRSFHDEAEIAHLRTALRAIESPDDALAVYAALRGPLFAHGDADLWIYRSLVGALSPFEVPRARDGLSDAGRAIADSLDLLRSLHRGRARRPIAETLSRLLVETGTPLALAAADGGELLLLRVRRLVELAAERDARGALSFRRFVEDLEDAAARREEVPVAAPAGLDAVQFRTVHAAKGLEFPVVVLIDPTTPPERPAKIVDPARSLYVDRFLDLEPLEQRAHAREAKERGAAEGARLLYVAATRARDLLVVPTTGEGPIGGWLAPLEAALRPDTPRAPERWAGGERFGARTVLEGRDASSLDGPSAAEVAPGLHTVRTDRGPARVVFWDPAALAAPAAPRPVVRHPSILADVPGPEADAARAAHDRFVATRRARAEKSAASGARVLRLGALGLDAQAEAACTVDVEPLGLGLAPSPFFPSTRGAAIVEAALAGWAEEGADGAARRARLVAAELGAPEAEREAAVEVARAVAAHPDLAELLPTLRPCPLVMPIASRRIVEGSVLAAELPGVSDFALVVHAGPERVEVASLRARLAATALCQARGRPVRAILVAPFA